MGCYAIDTIIFEVDEVGCRQKPPSVLWFGGSYLSMVVLTTSLNDFPYGIQITFLRGKRQILTKQALSNVSLCNVCKQNRTPKEAVPKSIEFLL